MGDGGRRGAVASQSPSSQSHAALLQALLQKSSPRMFGRQPSWHSGGGDGGGRPGGVGGGLGCGGGGLHMPKSKEHAVLSHGGSHCQLYCMSCVHPGAHGRGGSDHCASVGCWNPHGNRRDGDASQRATHAQVADYMSHV